MSSRQSMPFSQILEVPASGEERDCQVRVEVTQLECQPSIGDGAMLEVDLELLAQAVVRGRRPVAILQDLYSTQWLTELQAEPQSLSCPVDQGSLAQPVRELLESQELARSVVDSRLAPGQVVQSREGEQLVLTCPPELAGYFAQFGFVSTGEGPDGTDMAMDIRLVMREIPEEP